MQPNIHIARQDERAIFYSFPGKIEGEASNAVIGCTISVYDRMDDMVFYLGSTYYCVSVCFAFILI